MRVRGGKVILERGKETDKIGGRMRETDNQTEI